MNWLDVIIGILLYFITLGIALGLLRHKSWKNDHHNTNHKDVVKRSRRYLHRAVDRTQ